MLAMNRAQKRPPTLLLGTISQGAQTTPCCKTAHEWKAVLLFSYFVPVLMKYFNNTVMIVHHTDLKNVMDG